jgi:hypothetical protein
MRLEHGGQEWARFKVPATERERISPARLEMEKRQMGESWFRQEYLCEFVATESQMFDSDSVERALEDFEGWNL